MRRFLDNIDLHTVPVAVLTGLIWGMMIARSQAFAHRVHRNEWETIGISGLMCLLPPLVMAAARACGGARGQRLVTLLATAGAAVVIVGTIGGAVHGLRVLYAVLTGAPVPA